MSNVDVLAWKVTGDPHIVEAWYAYIKGRSLSIGFIHDQNGTFRHASEDHSDKGVSAPLYAANVLDGWTFASKGDLALEPTVFTVQEPPEGPVDSIEFQKWVHTHVVDRIDGELMTRALSKATFTFGKPVPAFTR